MAECSESTGSIGALCSRDIFITIEPAATSVSLFARAIIFPAFMAERVGASPLKPTMEATTISILSAFTSSQTESIPANTFMSLSWSASATSRYLSGLQITTQPASNSIAWRISSSLLLLAVRSSTWKRSGCWRTTSSVCVPMEPVEPSIAILLFICLDSETDIL